MTPEPAHLASPGETSTAPAKTQTAGNTTPRPAASKVKIGLLKVSGLVGDNNTAGELLTDLLASTVTLDVTIPARTGLDEWRPPRYRANG